MSEAIVLYRNGLARFLGPLRDEIRMDPAAGRITRKGRVIDMKDLRHLEVEREFLTLGTASQWESIDLHKYRDDSGPLVTGGAFSPSAIRLVEAIKAAILGNRQSAPQLGLEESFLPLDFRYTLRIDYWSIGLSAVFLGAVLLFGEMEFRWEGLPWFLGVVFAWWAYLAVTRRLSGLRCDEEGLTARGVLGRRTYLWGDVEEFRRQMGELEVVGRGFRLPVRVDILAAGATPLVLRRGRMALLSLPGRLFLSCLRRRARERAEPPLEIPRTERRRAFFWAGTIIVANVLFFLMEMGPHGVAEERQRLVALGARVGDWTHEPWRLLASLFLHANLAHLLMNMLLLALVAPWVGRVFGWGGGSALYLAGGFFGNILGEVFMDLAKGSAREEIAVGASTALLALLGGLLGAIYRKPEAVPLAARSRFRWAIPLTLILTLALGWVLRNLDNAAHVGGFLAGLGLAWVIPLADPAGGRREEAR